jgi:putative ABC transport system permease protein
MSLRTRLRSLFHKDELNRELEEELRSHVEICAEDNIADGMNPKEALYQARRQFGNVTRHKEEARSMDTIGSLETAAKDIRFAMRLLRRSPGFTAVAVFTLALGIGANTAIFSVIDAALLQPLPYQDPERLVIVWEKNDKQPDHHNTVAPPNFLDWQSQNDSFSGMAAIADERDNLTGDGQPQQVVVQLVSANFFSVLGVNPIIGRAFAPETEQKGKDNVVVLSYAFWKERFGADPGIIGKTLDLNGHSQTVIGVAPEKFDWFIKQGSLTTAKPQLWSPFVFPEGFHNRKDVGHFLTAVARMKPGITRPQAQARMDTIAARLVQQYPDYNAHWGVSLVPVREQISGDLRPALLILFAAVGFVLLIACANVSSLLLARAAGREREMAIRTAIGASRWRIARQLLTESALLALVGGGIGVTLAVWGTNALLAASPENLLDLRSIHIDLRVLAFAGGATLFAAFLFGFLPSYMSAHSRISETLKEGGRGASSGRHRRVLRSAFVVSQMALALVLLAGSGLMIQSFVRLLGVDPGMDTRNLLTFTVALPGSKYGTDEKTLGFFQQLLPRLAHLPGVRSVSMDSCPPLSGLGSATAVHIIGQPNRGLMDLPVAAVRVVGPEYIRTMGIPLRFGREFNSQELAEMRHVVILNQAFADKYLQGTNPLGQKAVIYMKSDAEAENQPSEIIGVVGDVRLMGLDTPAEPTVYWPHPELVYTRMTILARTANDPLALVSAARSEVLQLDQEQPISNVATMEQLLAGSVSRSRFTTLLLGLFAGIALVLATVGIYGVIAYMVTQRTQEIGMRMALGARPRDVLRLVLSQGTRLTLLGVAVGVVAALLLTRLMASLLFGISASDPVTFAGVAVLLIVVALAACYIPARRAMRVDPIVALRYE